MTPTKPRDVQIAEIAPNTTVLRSRTWERLKFENGCLVGDSDLGEIDRRTDIKLTLIKNLLTGVLEQ
jgi:hypothetical protein